MAVAPVVTYAAGAATVRTQVRRRLCPSNCALLRDTREKPIRAFYDLARRFRIRVCDLRVVHEAHA